MLTEQNVEFKVRGSGPPGGMCTSINDCFHAQHLFFYSTKNGSKNKDLLHLRS